MSRDILPRRLDADTFLSRHSAQPFERALVIEWSCSGDVVSCFVSSHETVRAFFSPVVPFTVVTAPFVSETASLTVIHFMSGNAWSYRRLVAYGFLGLSERGIGWIRRLACLKHGPDLYDGYFPSNPSVSRTRQLPPGIVPRWNGLFARDPQAACCFK